MHCALNAVNSGVPTVFLSYSEKSKGMACLVYGSSDFVLPLDKINQISPALLTRVMNTFDYNNVKQLREYSFERFKTRI